MSRPNIPPDALPPRVWSARLANEASHAATNKPPAYYAARRNIAHTKDLRSDVATLAKQSIAYAWRVGRAPERDLPPHPSALAQLVQYGVPTAHTDLTRPTPEVSRRRVEPLRAPTMLPTRRADAGEAVLAGTAGESERPLHAAAGRAPAPLYPSACWAPAPVRAPPGSEAQRWLRGELALSQLDLSERGEAEARRIDEVAVADAEASVVQLQKLLLWRSSQEGACRATCGMTRAHWLRAKRDLSAHARIDDELQN